MVPTGSNKVIFKTISDLDLLESPLRLKLVMKPAITLANWIINNFPDKYERDSLSHLKLQKLSYYCYGISKALCSEEIDTIEFEAWQYGPVSRDIYAQYKVFGMDPIPKSDEVIAPVFSEKLEKIFTAVCEIYGGMSAFKLVEQTHVEKPWRETWDSGKRFISEDMMIDYFSKQYMVNDTRAPSLLFEDGFLFLDLIPIQKFRDIFDLAKTAKNPVIALI